MEQSINRFLDASRQLDCFFVQKRILLSKYRPEPHGKEVFVLLAFIPRSDDIQAFTVCQAVATAVYIHLPVFHVVQCLNMCIQ
jgi:hypothetical protein